MSIRDLQESSLSAKTLAGATYLNGEWVRNPSWLPLAPITSSDQKFTGLYQINRYANFIAFNFTTSGGAQYEIDWGDGSAPQLVNSATQANYEYDFNDVDLAGTDAPVTFTASGSTVDRTAHGYTDGMNISFATIVTTTGIVATQTYYVVNATLDTFQVSDSVGGSPITLTNDGSGTILPYKQVVVTVTPVSGNLTVGNLRLKHSQAGLQNGYVTGWLDIAFAGSYTSISISPNSGVVRFQYQQADILSSELTSYSELFGRNTQPADINPVYNIVSINSSATVTSTNAMFRGCLVKRVPYFNTTNVTVMTNMFTDCYNLEEIPLLDTSNVTIMESMFQSCISLTSVPLFNTANVTIMTGMFGQSYTGSLGCPSLTSIPLFNTSNVTNMQNMLSGCPSITSVPLFDTANVTTMQNMFGITVTGSLGCPSLTSIPLFNTSNVTNMQNMLSGCPSITSVPLFDTSKVTNMSSMFQSCLSLNSVPLFNTSNVTNMASMFNSCPSLTSVPLFDTSNNANMANMFNSCRALSSVPPFDTSNNANMANIFGGCLSLKQIPALDQRKAATTLYSTFQPSLTKNEAFGAVVTFSVQGCMLSGAALDEIYTNLGRVGNVGTANNSVTFQGTADTVTKDGHGFANLDAVRFSGITTTTGIAINTNYYTINVTANTFQLTTTLTGSAIDLVNNGTGLISNAAITVTNNYGTATDDPTIATSKGWVVTGS